MQLNSDLILHLLEGKKCLATMMGEGIRKRKGIVDCSFHRDGLLHPKPMLLHLSFGSYITSK